MSKFTYGKFIRGTYVIDGSFRQRGIWDIHQTGRWELRHDRRAYLCTAAHTEALSAQWTRHGCERLMGHVATSKFKLPYAEHACTPATRHADVVQLERAWVSGG